MVMMTLVLGLSVVLGEGCTEGRLVGLRDSEVKSTVGVGVTLVWDVWVVWVV